MGFFDDVADFGKSVLRPVTNVARKTTRLTATAAAVTLGVPVALVREALDAGCKTLEDVRRYVKRQ